MLSSCEGCVWSAVPCVTHVGRGCISWLDTASCNYSLHKSSSITLHTRCYHSFSILLSCSLCVLPSTWSHYRPVSLFTATAAWVSDKHTDHFNCLVSINICYSLLYSHNALSFVNIIVDDFECGWDAIVVLRCAISGHFGGQKSIFDQPGSITRVWLLMSVNQTSLLLNSSIGICRASPSLGQAAAILVLSWLSCRVLIDAALTARGCDKRRVLASSNGHTVVPVAGVAHARRGKPTPCKSMADHCSFFVVTFPVAWSDECE